MNKVISGLRWLVVAVGLSVIPVALIAAISARLPASGRMAPLPRAEALDYLTRPSLLSPLSPRFIEQVLGTEVGAGLVTKEGASRTAPALADHPARLTDVHAFNNDNFADARMVPSIPFTAKTVSHTASRESGESSACSSTGGTVWYRYAPTQDGTLVAYTFGSDHTLSLGVFETRSGNLELLRCDTDVAGNAIASFPAKAGHGYYFQIASPVGGNLIFSLDPHGVITRASISSSGEQSNGADALPGVSMSADGRYVAFVSSAPNFSGGRETAECVAEDPTFAADADEQCSQIYVRDRLGGTTTLVSVSSLGVPGDSNSENVFISESGRHVVFESAARNFVDGDTQASWDVFVHDLATRRTERIPAIGRAAQESIQLNAGGFFVPTISSNGRFVAFASPASDLVPGDTNDAWDAFVYDRTTGATERVSVSSNGEQAQTLNSQFRYALGPSISANGRFVAFRSDAANLVPGDTNGVIDDFVHDRLTHKTERVSVSSSGEQGNGASNAAHAYPWNRISGDGRYVAFASLASNLVAGDTNDGLDVFVRDRVENTTYRVSVSSAGDQAADEENLGNLAFAPNSISSDGRYVTFESSARNLAPGDSDSGPDVFLHDLITRTTLLITISPTGEESAGQIPVVSRDGRFVAFSSAASNLVDGDTNGIADVFVWESARAR